MKLFAGTPSNFYKIINSISQYTPNLPPNVRRRLSAWLLWERLLRKPALPPPGKQLPLSARRLIENQASLFSGYMVMFAHDDAVDKYNLSTAQIYGQLSRCLAAFLMSIPIKDGPRTVGALRSTMNQWSDRMREIMLPFPKIAADLPYLFDASSMLRGLSDNTPLIIQHLFLKDEHEELCLEWLNMTIFSAMEMGLAFSKILSVIKQHLTDNEADLQRRNEFLVTILVKCMYAQAHSPEQRDLEMFQYERYIELAYLKSNVLLDMPNYVSDQLDEQRYFATRYNSSRCCEQLYDDLQDFEEDTRDGVLNILHIQIVEQGRLAEKFLAMLEKQPQSLSVVQELLSNTIILRSTFDQTFMYSNPYIQAERDEQGNPRMISENAEAILREMWVNAPEELSWTVEALARHRLALYESFKTAWQAQNYPAVLDVVYRSNFPLALLRVLYHFMNQNKRVIIESHKQHGAPVAGYLSYFLVSAGIEALRVDIWKKRIFRPKYV
jgi:hypothetical protein